LLRPFESSMLDAEIEQRRLELEDTHRGVCGLASPLISQHSGETVTRP
jgi:hypothetical protein